MNTVVVAFLISLAVAFLLTPMVRDAAIRFGALDHALTSRKAHGRPTPRLGGIAIVVAFYLPLVALFFFDTGVGRLFWSQPERALALILGGLAMAALGIYDDLKGSGARIKFTVQILIACLMWWAGYRADVIATPFGTLELGVLGFPVTVLWIVGITNALNLIDGLDGLATGIALAAAATIFWVAFANDRPLMTLFMVCLAGALLGFLRYNFHPASIFMGDSGSLFVGFVLAATALQTHEKSTTAVSLLVPIVALGLPIGDTLLAMTRRMVRGQPMFSSDRGHIHHRLMDRGLSHKGTVLALYGIAVVLGGVAVALYHSDAEQTLAYGGAILAIAVMLLVAAGYIPFGQGSEAAHRPQAEPGHAGCRAEGGRAAEAGRARGGHLGGGAGGGGGAQGELRGAGGGGAERDGPAHRVLLGIRPGAVELAPGQVQPAGGEAGRGAHRAGVQRRAADRGQGHGDRRRAAVRARARGGRADRGGARGGEDGRKEAETDQGVGGRAQAGGIELALVAW